jgi:hypothetical protein
MSIENNGNRLIEELVEHIDSVVTIHTEGCKCHGFTGLLTCVNCDSVKIITCCDGCGEHFGGGCSGGFGRRFGTVTIIPICEITAVTFCNTTF